MKYHILLIPALAVLVNGCTTTGNLVGPLLFESSSGETSSAGFEINPASSQIIAEDLVKNMDGIIPVTKNLALITNSPAMTSALEGKLRERGYAVKILDKPNSEGSELPVTYSFDRFEDGQVWAQLRVGNSFEVSRLYNDKIGILKPISPMTIRQLKAFDA